MTSLAALLQNSETSVRTTNQISWRKILYLSKQI